MKITWVNKRRTRFNVSWKVPWSIIKQDKERIRLEDTHCTPHRSLYFFHRFVTRSDNNDTLVRRADFLLWFDIYIFKASL